MLKNLLNKSTARLSQLYYVEYFYAKKKIVFIKVENPGIDPGTSRMLSERSTM